MNNSIKSSNTKEVKIQLKRAEVQKKILIKNIYKEYDIYFNIVRKSILSSAEKGIFGMYSDFLITDSDKSLNKRELINFLNQNIKLLINSKLPLLTIEQLKLGDISDPQKQLVNEKPLEELVEFKEIQAVDFDYDNQLITKESLEFNCISNTNLYEYYELYNEDEFSSLNLDKNHFLNYFSRQNNIKNINFEKTPNKLNNHQNIIDQVNDVFISSDNLDFFEIIDKEFSNFLLNLSYKINLELFKINLIKKNINEDTFKCLSNNIIKHPHPFVIKYDLNSNNLSEYRDKYSYISLFKLSNVELEFYNFDLLNCRNKINLFKNKYTLLHKKQLYWKKKALT